MSANIFASADYSGLELRTMAEACIQLVGFSKLAEALNSGRDVHLALAATILGISYEEAQERKDAGDKRVDDARQTAKVGNFGFAGGLGAEKFVLFARKAYKVKLTVAEAKKLKADWLRTWPEFVEFFKLHAELSRAAGAQGITYKQLFSNRIRGGMSYAAACNGRFQGLGADATGNAAFLISEACYVGGPCRACMLARLFPVYDHCAWCEGTGQTPLFGSRMVRYVHDDFHLETQRRRGHEVAHELVRFMIEGAAPYLPHVPAIAEPLLSAYWSKEAFAIFGAGGRLFPWDAELGAIIRALPKRKEPYAAHDEGVEDYPRQTGKKLVQLAAQHPKAKFKLDGNVIELVQKDQPIQRIAA